MPELQSQEEKHRNPKGNDHGVQEGKRGKGPLTDLHRGTPRFAARDIVPQSAPPCSRESHRQSHRAFPPMSTSKIHFKNTTPKPSHRTFPHVGIRIAGDEEEGRERDGKEGRKRGTGKEEQERHRNPRGNDPEVQEGKRGKGPLTDLHRGTPRFAARDIVPQSAPPCSRESHRQSHRAFPPMSTSKIHFKNTTPKPSHRTFPHVGIRIAGDEEEGRERDGKEGRKRGTGKEEQERHRNPKGNDP